MLTWIWHFSPDSVDHFFVQYDHSYSTLKGYLVEGPQPIPEGAGRVVYSAKRYSAARIRRYGSLNTASRERVIHQRLIPALAQAVPPDQYQLYPVSVIAKGGERLEEFLAVIPLNEVTCTDVERSEITGWLAPQFVGKVALHYKSLAHVAGCLGKLSLARDSITGLVVVSHALKQALEATKEPGMFFKKPEDMQTWMY